MINHATKDNYKQLMSTGKVILDFYADWCGPCKMLGPVFEKVSNDVANVAFVKINVDEIETAAREFGVASIPTLVVLQDGKEVKRHVGFLTEDGIRDLIK